MLIGSGCFWPFLALASWAKQGHAYWAYTDFFLCILAHGSTMSVYNEYNVQTCMQIKSHKSVWSILISLCPRGLRICIWGWSTSLRACPWPWRLPLGTGGRRRWCTRALVALVPEETIEMPKVRQIGAKDCHRLLCFSMFFLFPGAHDSWVLDSKSISGTVAEPVLLHYWIHLIPVNLILRNAFDRFDRSVGEPCLDREKMAADKLRSDWMHSEKTFMKPSCI